MAGKEVAGEGLSANIAGMSKNQLYDIMCQMKKLMEQNEKQARQILIQNPTLARDLFQAQIMLGMVKPAQPMSTPTPATQSTQPSPSHVQQSSNQAAPAVSAQSGLQDQMRKQHHSQPPLSMSSSIAPSSNLQPPSLPSHPLQQVQQPKGHTSAPSAPMSLPQSAQAPNMPPLPHHSAAQPPPHLQSHMPSAPTQLDQSIQTSGIQHLPLQPPLPPQMRPSMQSFPQQIHPQMGPNVGFQQSGTQMHHSQPMFHAAKPPAPMGPSFMQGQPQLPNQPPPQSLYQAGSSHIRTDFNQVGSSMPTDRGSAWIPGLPESAPTGQLPGPPPPFPSQMGPGNQPARQPALTPEMEQALLQQVMSLTPEQINSLPPEQRTQVLQLQQMLRK
nr:cleavage stimulating factor 64 [Ipomoea batatas]